MARRKKKDDPAKEISVQLFNDRGRRAKLESLKAEAGRRREALRKELRPFVRGAVFDLADQLDGADTLRLLQGGEARERGIPLTALPWLRLRIQESIGFDSEGERRIVLYSYQVYADEGQTQLLRFEYHPIKGQKGRFSSKHHLHTIQLDNITHPLRDCMSNLHLPVAEFVEEPVDAAGVLPKVLEWVLQEFGSD